LAFAGSLNSYVVATIETQLKDIDYQDMLKLADVWAE